MVLPRAVERITCKKWPGGIPEVLEMGFPIFLAFSQYADTPGDAIVGVCYLCN